MVIIGEIVVGIKFVKKILGTLEKILMELKGMVIGTRMRA